jgi:hypothetical protein
MVFSKKIFGADSNEIAASYPIGCLNSGIGKVPVIDPSCWRGSQKYEFFICWRGSQKYEFFCFF